MGRTFTILFLCLATVGSFGWGLYEHRQVLQLKQEQVRLAEQQTKAENSTIADLREQLQEQRRSNETLKRSHESTLARLNRRSDAMQSAPAERPAMNNLLQSFKSGLGKAAAASPGSGSDDSAPGKPMMAQFAKAFKNPEMKKMIATQQKAMLDMSYGSLYGMLNLPPEKLAAFKDLLAKRQSDLTNLGLEMLDDTLTAEQKKENQTKIAALTAQSAKDIETLLGKDNNTVYKAYEETQPERMQVNTFNKGLSTDQQLSDLKENDLIMAMHKARSDFKFTTNLQQKPEANFDPSTLTPDVMNKFFEENRQLNSQYVTLAAKMLTPEQLKSFQSSLEQQQAMQEFGLKMVGGMAGGGAKGAPPAPAANKK